jgi:F-type H+-transporting ATPase subunit delta
MAEFATIARPYAEALFKAAGGDDLQAISDQVDMLAAIADNDALRAFADSPKVSPEQLIALISGVANTPVLPKVSRLLQALIDNGRLPVLPEVANQFHALVNARAGVSDARIISAFALSGAALDDVVAVLAKRFNRKLNAAVEIDASLIGGIRVVVGDEVLDTSIKARLEQMKVALTA